MPAESFIQPERKVWVVDVPPRQEYLEPGFQVLIEQFGDHPPTVAFRPTSMHTWGRPYESHEAP